MFLAKASPAVRPAKPGRAIAVAVAAVCALALTTVGSPASASIGATRAATVVAGGSAGVRLVVAPLNGPTADRLYQLKIEQRSNGSIYLWCLDADSSAGHLYDGSKVQLWTCGQGYNQYWKWTSDGYLKNLWNEDFCLDVDLQTPSAQNADGHKLWMWHCANQSDQRWSWNTNSDYSLQSHWNGKCADANQSGIGKGDPIALWGCVSGKFNQQWFYGGPY
ncbi:RICIN domain-containing protein [Actinoplanes subtropicus]|uniref:RICIN domain-containing protein n=1 Tax=Actinoplanes subtropicus TaxID=543632 RepID=UPI0004C381D7|nr:RICIN domain-containing protein [Actinoplanes subtropicus]